MRITTRFIYILLSGILIFSAYQGFTESQNASGKTGHTGAPGEPTCAACHGSTSGSGGLAIAGDFNTLQYTAGQTYNMTVTITHPNFSKFGFNLVALDSGNTSIGTLTAGTGSQILTGPMSRSNITHTNAGTASSTTGSKTFSFTWTAPSTYAGKVTFYAAGNAANGNNSDSGDFIYTGTLEVTAAAATGLTSDLNQQIQISPNPVFQGNAVQMHIPSDAKEIRVTDFNGRTLMRIQAENLAGTKYAMPTQLLETGIYILSIETTDGIRNQRLSVR